MRSRRSLHSRRIGRRRKINEFYYSASPTSPHDVKRHEIEARGVKIQALTDSGVFSKGELDYGTRLLIESIHDVKGRFLDLGCGWGAIGIIMAKAFEDLDVTMSDVNERAVELAGKNAELNGVKNAVAVVSDGLKDVDGSFDIISLNPPIRAGKSIVYSLFEQCLEGLKPEGKLYVVVRKQQGAESAMARLKEIFANAQRINRDKGYWIIECRKDEIQ